MYIIGLGNLGLKYENTRHNMGWMVLDTLASECSARLEFNKYWNAKYNLLELGGQVHYLVYPQTFMNKSGYTVKAILQQNVDSKFLVIHDDIALPLGSVRVSIGRGDGGHNGVKSINSEIKTKEYPRIRVGIAGKKFLSSEHYQPHGADLPKYVLQKFSFWEKKQVDIAINQAVSAVFLIIEQGVEMAMNNVNKS